MNEPQVWVLIGVFAAALVGMTTVVLTSLSRQLRDGFARVTSDTAAAVAGLELRVMERFHGVERRLDGVERRLEAQDRDIATLMRRAADDDGS